VPLTKSTLLLTSKENLGAHRIGEILLAKYTSQSEAFGKANAKAHLTFSQISTDRELESLLKAAAKTGQVVSMLLLLDRATFAVDCERGLRLGEQLRIARMWGIHLLLMHDEDSCEFETVMLATPDDLVMQGIYKHIAITLCRSSALEEEASLLLAFKDLEQNVRGPPRPPALSKATHHASSKKMRVGFRPSHRSTNQHRTSRSSLPGSSRNLFAALSYGSQKSIIAASSVQSANQKTLERTSTEDHPTKKTLGRVSTDDEGVDQGHQIKPPLSRHEEHASRSSETNESQQNGAKHPDRKAVRISVGARMSVGATAVRAPGRHTLVESRRRRSSLVADPAHLANLAVAANQWIDKDARSSDQWESQREYQRESLGVVSLHREPDEASDAPNEALHRRRSHLYDSELGSSQLREPPPSYRGSAPTSRQVSPRVIKNEQECSA